MTRVKLNWVFELQISLFRDKEEFTLILGFFDQWDFLFIILFCFNEPGFVLRTDEEIKCLFCVFKYVMNFS